MIRNRLGIMMILLATAAPALGQTAFSYQGVLDVAGSPVNGDYNLQFRLYDAADRGNQIGAQVELLNQPLSDGLVNATLDFGDVFDAEPRWLEISVQEVGGGTWETLTPRQEILPTPQARNAQLLEGMTAAELMSQGVPNPLVLSGGTSATIKGTTTSSTLGDAGVVGMAGGLSGQSQGTGVKGNGPTFSPNGTGVWGQVGMGKGVYGQAYLSQGVNYGVYGETGSEFGYAGYFVGGRNHFEGNVGIGTTDTPLPLTLRAPTGLGNCGITQNNLGGEYTMEFMTQDQNGLLRTRMMLRGNYSDAIEFFRGDAGAEQLSMIITSSGRVGIGTASPTEMLDVAGTTRTDVLQIDGGSDLSEGFGADAPAEPGMVMVIDEDRPGQLRLSDAAYDRRVAGIVSGAGGIRPGLIMGQDGSIADGEIPVALTGRVYCWVDADLAPVRPGDLLTTADRPGHAMKAVDRDRSPGATLGKAMTSLDRGQGLVLVLVGLQ